MTEAGTQPGRHGDDPSGGGRHKHLESGRDVGMDRLRQFLDAVRTQSVAAGHFRGLLHLLIGESIRLADGAPVSSGMNWRALAGVLKKSRWDREAVRELGLDPRELPPRDREKFWYAAIARADVTSPAATASARALADKLRPLGYEIGPTPSRGATSEEPEP
jgi:hypothetical protein